MQEQPTVARVALKYGLITGVVSIVFNTILIIAEQNQNKALGSLGLIIMIVGMVYAMREFKTGNDGFMSYGQGLGIGTLMAAISGFLGGAFIMFYSQFIDTNYTQKMMDYSRIELEQRGVSDAQIEAGMEFNEKFMSPGIMFGATILGAIFFGFIIALIVSAIMRRNRPVFE